MSVLIKISNEPIIYLFIVGIFKVFSIWLKCLILSSNWIVAQLCRLIFVENMKNQRQELRNSEKLKWWSGMDEKVAVIKTWSWNPQFLLKLKNSFFLGSKNDKTMLTQKQITLRRNKMAKQSNENHWHFFLCIRYHRSYSKFFILVNLT